MVRKFSKKKHSMATSTLISKMTNRNHTTLNFGVVKFLKSKNQENYLQFYILLNIARAQVV